MLEKLRTTFALSPMVAKVFKDFSFVFFLVLMMNALDISAAEDGNSTGHTHSNKKE